MPTEQETMNAIAREWLAARTVIADFLAEISGGQRVHKSVHEHNAAAILARLAHHKPPILISMEAR